MASGPRSSGSESPGSAPSGPLTPGSATGAELDRGWETARLLWTLDPAVAYLDHGAYGAVPLPVQRAQQRLRDEAEADPMRFYARGLPDRLPAARRHLARFVGADPDGTALVANASTGINLVLHSFPLRPGDEVLVTDHGHVPARHAVERACRAAGASVVTARIPLTADDDTLVQLVRSRVTPRTRLAVLDHVTSATARLLPLDRLVGPLRADGVAVLVDAAHGPGMLPVDVTALGADFWVGNLHTWAAAPRGTALLAVEPRRRSAMRSFVVSWGEDAGFPTAVENTGTGDPTGWLAAPVGLHTLSMFGWQALRARNAALAAWGQRVVADAIGADLGDLPVHPAVSMRIVPLPAGVATTPAAARELQGRIAVEAGCEVAVSAWRGQGLLRVSGQAYNRTTEYVRLADALPGVLAGMPTQG
ncbi:MAG TPA: aminotransferase class V-fold PLP-dependent enzyme [Mycobacteriales bacterium]